MSMEPAYQRGLDVTERVIGTRLEIPLGPGEPESGMDMRRFTIGHTFGDSWTRTAIDERTRSMLTIAISATLGTQVPLRGHIQIARNLGVTPDEIVDLFIHIAAYAGAPLAFSGYQIALEVFAAEYARAQEGSGSAAAPSVD